jgi:hypothetical protein
VGLDVGYTGTGALYKKRESNTDLHNELEARMPEYLQEYEHRQQEKALSLRMKLDPIPASSIHNESLHGSSYHGRKVVTAIESLDFSNGNKSSEH